MFKESIKIVLYFIQIFNRYLSNLRFQLRKLNIIDREHLNNLIMKCIK